MIFKILILFILVLIAIFCILLLIKPNTKTENYKEGNLFVRWDSAQGHFERNGKQFFATGCNMPWMGLIVANDSMTCFVQPKEKDIVETLTYARNRLNCNVIRCHTLGFSAFSDNSFLLPSSDGKLNINQNYWKAVDRIIRTARKLDILLIPVMTDQYNGYNGNYNIFLGKKETSADFFNIKSIAFANYKDFLCAFLNHTVDGIALKDEPTIFCIEFGNELGDHYGMGSSNCIPDACIRCCYNSDCNQKYDCKNFKDFNVPQAPLSIPGTSCHVPTKEWMIATMNHIRSIDKSHMLMTGGNWCQLNPPSQTGGQSCEWDLDGIDIISFHWYYCVNPTSTDFSYNKFDHNRFDEMRSACKNVRNKNKAVIFGEYPATYGNIKDFFTNIEGMIDKGLLQGELFWDLVYDEYISYGADVESNMCEAPNGFAVAPKRDANLLQMYSQHFLKYKYTETCMTESDCHAKCGKSQPSKKTAVFIGDSITAGYNCGTRRKNMDQCRNCKTTDNGYDKIDFSQCHTYSKVEIPNSTFPSAPNGYSFFPNCSMSYPELIGNELSTRGYDANIYDFATSGSVLDNYSGCFNCYNDSMKGYQDLMNPALINLNPIDVDYIFIMFGTNHAINQYILNRCENNLQTCIDILKTNVQKLINSLKKIYLNTVFYILRPIPTFNDGSFLNLTFIDETLDQLKSLEDKEQIFYLDLYNEMKSKNFIVSETCDTVHPLDNGNYKIATIIVDHLDLPILSQNGKTYFYKSYDDGGWG